MTQWKPGAERDPYADAGTYESGFEPRLVWHTTEGTSLPAYGGSAPHFTIDPKTGKTWQHMPVDRVAKALKGKNVAGIATNAAHAIQVEIIGSAGESDSWPDSYYANLRDLASWIEEECGVEPVESVTFLSKAHPMSHSAWQAYRGHCGHQHVPGQDHWDPGLFKVAKVLGGDPGVNRNLELGMRGPDITELQRAISTRARGCCRPDHVVAIDGVHGSATKRGAAWAAYILGVGESQEDLMEGGVSEYVQRLVRDPSGRNDTQRDRAGARREKHCHCNRD